MIGRITTATLRTAAFVLVLLSPPLIDRPLATTSASCDQLPAMAIDKGTITMAQAVPAGDWQRTPAARVEQNMPAFCRVTATLRPASGSDIRMEVWLPSSTWNGRFQAAGTDGNAINYASGTDAVQTTGSSERASGMLRALRAGYATASTDAGQAGTNGTFGFGQPEHAQRLADFAYRAAHEMAVAAKAIVTAFYGKPPAFSYFNGCSAGGGQGVMEAHRFPDDYDGIIAGAPGSPLAHGYAAWRLWLAGATRGDAAAAIPSALLPMLHDAVVRACDANDGLKDGLIEDPRACRFNPETLTCKGSDAGPCLSVAQAATVTRLLTPVVNPRTNALIYPPLERGSELGWAGYTAAGREPPASAVGAFRYVFLRDPTWDWRTLDFDRHIALADEVIGAAGTNPLEPDLRAFAKRGGKLLLYQGWNDVSNAPQSTINYYERVRGVLGNAATSQTVRLFMAPGMAHCGYGDGPNTFDGMHALEQWVEHGRAPDRIVASRSLPSRGNASDADPTQTRPLCAFPSVARYQGSGDQRAAANFECHIQ